MTTIIVRLAMDVSEETAEDLCGTPVSWDTFRPYIFDAEPNIMVLGEIYESRDGDVSVERAAINNIRYATNRIQLVMGATRNEELAEAVAELEQAIRFLTGEETPS